MENAGNITGYRQEIDDDEIDLRALLETLRRQSALIIATVAICLIAAAIYLFSVTPLYTATTLVYVNPSQTDLLDPGSEVATNLSVANSRIESEVEILRSDTVALRVVSEEKLVRDPEFGPKIGLRDRVLLMLGFRSDEPEDAAAIVRGVVSRYKNATNISRRGQTFLVSVSITSESPQRAADLANAHASAYISEQVEGKIQSSLAARDVLQSQIATARERLAQSEEALDTFIAANLTRIETETGRSDVGDLAKILQSLEDSRLQKDVALRKAQADIEARNWQAVALDLEDEVLSELERQRAGIISRLGSVVRGSQEEIDLRNEIARLEARLEEQSTLGLDDLRQATQELASRQRDARQELRDTLFAGQLPPDLLTQVFEIQQDAANARSQYQNLLTRIRDVEAQAGVQIADSRIVSAALVPTAPSFPRRNLVLALALVLGAGLGAFLAFMREFFIGGFTSAEQLQDALQAPVASVVPYVGTPEDNERSPADRIVTDALSSYSEAIRRLRASVDQKVQAARQTEGAQPKESPVILVVSAVPNEGKTTTALALARTYSQAGKSVLLIDADLRKPHLHTFVGIEPKAGLLDYLRDPQSSTSMRAFSSADPMSDVTLLLGRGRSEVPTDQLVSSPSFEKILNGARKTFDVVIMDSSPLMPVVDGHYLAKYADAVIMVVRWASTGQGDVRSIRTSLREAMRPQATLLSILSHRQGRKRGGYSYNYGYGYGARDG